MTQPPDPRVTELLRDVHRCAARGEPSMAAYHYAAAVVGKLLADLDRMREERDAARENFLAARDARDAALSEVERLRGEIRDSERREDRALNRAVEAEARLARVEALAHEWKTCDGVEMEDGELVGPSPAVAKTLSHCADGVLAALAETDADEECFPPRAPSPLPESLSLDGRPMKPGYVGFGPDDGAAPCVCGHGAVMHSYLDGDCVLAECACDSYEDRGKAAPSSAPAKETP